MSRRSEILQRLVGEYEGKSGLIRVELWQQQPNTAARVMCNVPEYPHMRALGFSKVRHPDVFDAQRGVQIAVNKALGQIAKELAEWEEAQEQEGEVT